MANAKANTCTLDPLVSTSKQFSAETFLFSSELFFDFNQEIKLFNQEDVRRLIRRLFQLRDRRR